MITSTNLRELLNLEFFQVLSNVLVYLHEEKPEDLKLTSVITDLEQKLKVLDEVLVVARGNVLSKKLLELDRARDVAYRAFYGTLRIYANFPDEEKSGSALFLMKLVDKYGKNIDKMSYVQQSGALVNIFQELEESENVDRISLLHLDEWVAQLKKAQADFDRLFLGRESENSTLLSGQTRDARAAVQESFDNLGKYVNACELVFGVESYAPLCAKINEAVNYARAQAARRGPRKTTKDKNVAEE